ncbi:MAG: hypothetical protein DMF67_17350 [Acidobacteria bacterium]|nr:MAG: hypothetical protein DMF66_14150 [Acidobacteriota bacterium]PYS81266.1 MAG: hypothetical protein DMF67_17350 [Acidobacteriota bacterium]
MSADETRVNEILRAVRAARSRLEDESRPAFDWEERLETSRLLAGAIRRLEEMRKEEGKVVRLDLWKQIHARPGDRAS